VRAGYAGGGDMSDYAELKRLAEAFPADLDWDSNTEPFFNGPSGESLGGGSTGFYCVYGKPFRLEGEDYDYDGPTYVEICTADFAKFMVSARDGMLALIAERDQLKAENGSLRNEADQLHHECARFRKNSDRYRWLRDMHIGNDPESINLDSSDKRGLDAAIDYAMSKEP